VRLGVAVGAAASVGGTGVGVGAKVLFAENGVGVADGGRSIVGVRAGAAVQAERQITWTRLARWTLLINSESITNSKTRRVGKDKNTPLLSHLVDKLLSRGDEEAKNLICQICVSPRRA
jgi:hypothetical protein